MSITLRQKQSLFAKHLASLIDHAYGIGYEITIQTVYRSPEENERVGGHPRSTHLKKLAADLNLFKDGRYLSSTESHRELGEWWEQQNELARWGGRFNDGNHYSFIHAGVS